MEKKYNNPALEEQIDLYLSGALNREEIELLWEQLLEQPHYVDYMKTCANLRKLGEADNSSSMKLVKDETRSYDFRYAIAACFILLLSVISVLVIFPAIGDNQPEPLATLELNNLRSSAVSEFEYEREMQRGINLAVLGQSEEALEVFNQLLVEADSEDLKLDVMINIGIIHYNLADYEAAKTSFLAVTQNPQAELLVEEKAWWYLANTYLKSNHREDAKVAAQHVYDVNGAYRRMAARWLERL